MPQNEVPRVTADPLPVQAVSTECDIVEACVAPPSPHRARMAWSKKVIPHHDLGIPCIIEMFTNTGHENELFEIDRICAGGICRANPFQQRLAILR